jgi:glycosyltransferase involved in cell wall biosynthesis
MNKQSSPSILFVSTFPPRECGIATFTQDLTNAIDKEFAPEIKSRILAINDSETSFYNYPRKVSLQISEHEIEDYINCANFINRSPNIKLVSIQHEYGLYGGDWGDYLLLFLELIKKPILVTMHTVLPTPGEKLKKLTKTITEKAASVVVMTKSAQSLLIDVYGVKKHKIHVIPHGVHHIPFPSKHKAKKKLNLIGRTVLSTFGMLNRDKGIEYAIAALPEVVKEHPDIIYLVLGATHPNIVKQEGEVYRTKLEKLVTSLNLGDNVKFYNKYLDLEELIDYLKATDIYLSPTLNPQQAVSGTISYALACACPIVATANQYAKDTVNHERGRLVRFKNAGDIKNALLEILSNRKARKEMGKNSYFYSRHMTWQNVALSYFEVFNHFGKIVPRRRGKLPPIIMDYIKNLTDRFGMIQFANHTKPDVYSGYCLDDNARALIGCVNYYEMKKISSTLTLVEKYLNYIKFSQKGNGKFCNFIGYNKNFNDNAESEDSFGRAIWALGVLINSEKMPEDFKKKAEKIFYKAARWCTTLQSLRAISFAIVGLSYIIQKNKDEKTISLLTKLSDTLVEHFDEQLKKTEKDGWIWFEDCLTYSNFKLSESLFFAYKITRDKKYLEVAEKSLNFLMSVTFEHEDYFSPIGQDGWYFMNGPRAYFDQQPEDAASAVEAFTTAYRITNKNVYKEKAKLSFDWFLGKNHLRQMVYDEATGGCYDGLGRYSLNFNQGAESTLSYFLARLTVEKIDKK